MRARPIHSRAAARLYQWQLPLERRALRAALELVSPRSGERLLDVATGTGALLGELIERQPHPAGAIGIDRSATMLDRVPDLPEGWTVAQADARALPFPDDTFDVVTATYILHILDPSARAAVVGEVARVLRPGGRAVTVTVDTRRRRLRWLLARAPRASGLHPLDPRDELVGLAVREACYVEAGYPSLCVLAERARP